MTKEDGILSGELDALQQRFQEHSRKAQAYYAIMHSVRGILGSEAAASAWMENDLPTFDGKSPAILISEGREPDLLAYIYSLKSESGS